MFDGTLKTSQYEQLNIIVTEFFEELRPNCHILILDECIEADILIVFNIFCISTYLIWYKKYITQYFILDSEKTWSIIVNLLYAEFHQNNLFFRYLFMEIFIYSYIIGNCLKCMKYDHRLHYFCYC